MPCSGRGGERRRGRVLARGSCKKKKKTRKRRNEFFFIRLADLSLSQTPLQRTIEKTKPISPLSLFKKKQKPSKNGGSLPRRTHAPGRGRPGGLRDPRGREEEAVVSEKGGASERLEGWMMMILLLRLRPACSLKRRKARAACSVFCRNIRAPPVLFSPWSGPRAPPCAPSLAMERLPLRTRAVSEKRAPLELP